MAFPPHLTHKLQSGLSELNITASEAQFEQLTDYVQLLEKWNTAFNLTAIKNIDDMVSHHLLDSLAIAPYVTKDSLLDVGSGAGLPGIPLAILFPEKHITMIDTNIKKTRFIQQAIIQLKLDNALVIHDRVEKLDPDIQYHMITSRAFTELSNFIKLTQHLLAPGGEWLAMKGLIVKDELNTFDACSDEKYMVSCNALQVPFLDKARYLVTIKADITADNVIINSSKSS